MDCVSSAKATTRQIAQLPTFASAVHADNSISASALIELVSRRDGISLAGQERSVYRARTMVLNTTDEALRKSYELIGPYLDAFQKMNPGSTAMMDRDEDGRFKRAIIIVRTVADSLPHNQQILGVDCSHSKCQYYGGLQMHLVGSDGNMQNVTIAFALVPSEDIESYSWFFDVLARSGVDVSRIPLFCDRNTALLSVAETVDLNLKNCTAHIARNFVHENANVKQHHKVLVWQLQACYTENEYNNRLAWIEMELGTEAMRYLKRIPPRRWCVFANIGVQPLYGWRTSNFVESVSGTQLTLGIRGLPPFDFIKAVCSRIMSRAFKRSQLSLKWSQQGRKITPTATKIYDSQSQNIGHYLVDTASVDVHYVYNQRCSMHVQRRVTISSNHCTCGFMDQYRIPCRHLLAALKSLDKLDTAFDHFYRCYFVAVYAEAFQGKSVTLPLNEEIAGPDEITQPPARKKPRGRPPTKRIPSNGESSTYNCSRCKGPGHNVRTCRGDPK